MGDLGKGAVSELTGIENFEEQGRALIRDTKDAWRIVIETIEHIPHQDEEDPTETAQGPRVAARSEENNE